MIDDADLNTHAGLLAFQALCEACSAGDYLVEYRANAINVGWTLNDLIANASGHDEPSAQCWAYRSRVCMAGELGEEIRKRLSDLGATGALGHRWAAQMCVECSDLTPHESYGLLKKWHSAYRDSLEPLFPMIEKEWASKHGDA